MTIRKPDQKLVRNIPPKTSEEIFLEKLERISKQIESLAKKINNLNKNNSK